MRIFLRILLAILLPLVANAADQGIGKETSFSRQLKTNDTAFGWRDDTHLQVNHPLNVKWYGADSRGVVDSITAIQTAINTASANRGCTVHFPPGSYKISAPIRLREGVRLVGVNALCPTIVPAVSGMAAFWADGNVSSWSIDGFLVDYDPCVATGSPSANTNDIGVLITGTVTDYPYMFNVSNMMVNHAYRAFQDGTQGWMYSLNHVTAQAPGDVGFYLNGSPIKGTTIAFRNCFANTPLGWGWYVRNADSVSLLNCACDKSSTGALFLQQSRVTVTDFQYEQNHSSPYLGIISVLGGQVDFNGCKSYSSFIDNAGGESCEFMFDSAQVRMFGNDVVSPQYTGIGVSYTMLAHPNCGTILIEGGSYPAPAGMGGIGIGIYPNFANYFQFSGTNVTAPVLFTRDCWVDTNRFAVRSETVSIGDLSNEGRLHTFAPDLNSSIFESFSTTPYYRSRLNLRKSYGDMLAHTNVLAGNWLGSVEFEGRTTNTAGYGFIGPSAVIYSVTTSNYSGVNLLPAKLVLATADGTNTTTTDRITVEANGNLTSPKSLDFGGQLRATGLDTYMTTGSGLELAYNAGTHMGYVTSYDRDLNNYLGLTLRGTNLMLIANGNYAAYFNATSNYFPWPSCFGSDLYVNGTLRGADAILQADGSTLILAPAVSNNGSLIDFPISLGYTSRGLIGFLSNGDTNMTFNVNNGWGMFASPWGFKFTNGPVYFDQTKFVSFGPTNKLVPSGANLWYENGKLYSGFGVTNSADSSSALLVSGGSMAELSGTSAVRLRDGIASGNEVMWWLQAWSPVTSAGSALGLPEYPWETARIKSGLLNDLTTTNGASIGSGTIATFDTDTTAGNTRFLLWDVTAGTLKRVSVGAPDSGGSGYKVLRVPN